jgi:hypothetical protein
MSVSAIDGAAIVAVAVAIAVVVAAVVSIVFVVSTRIVATVVVDGSTHAAARVRFVLHLPYCPLGVEIGHGFGGSPLPPLTSMARSNPKLVHA